MSQARRTISLGFFCCCFFVCLFFFQVIYPERVSKPNYCALHNFLMVRNSLIIFGRGIDKDFDFLCYVLVTSLAEKLCS